MPAAKLTSKGQITIPQSVREDLGLTAGDRLDFVRLDDGSYAIKAATIPVTALKGMIPLRRKPASLKEMQAAIIAGAAKGHRVRGPKK